MRTRIAVPVIITISGLMLSACGGDRGDDAAAGDEMVTLTFANFYTGPDMATIDAMVEEFNATHDNIEVTNQAVLADTLEQELPNLVAAGNAPDIEAHHDVSHPRLAAAGAFESFTDDMLEQAGVSADDYFANIWELGSQGGEQYGIPFGTNAAVLYHNNALMAEMGVSSVPTTYDELVSAGQQCTTDTSGRHPGEPGFDASSLDTYGVGITVEWGAFIGAGALASHGGQLYDDSFEVAFDSPEGVATLEGLEDLVETHQISPPGVTFEADVASFRGSQSCFMLHGTWEFAGNQEAGLDFGVAPFPQLGPEREAAWGGAAWLTLPKQPDDYDQAKRDAALEFVAWATSFDGNLTWTESGNLPARPDVASSEEYADNAFAEIAQRVDTHYVPTGFAWIPQINAGWQLAYENVVSGRQEPAEAIEAAADEARATVEEAKANYPDAP